MNRFFQLFLRLGIAFTLIFILIIPQLISAKAPEGSKIANILVEGKTEQEIYTDLTTHITNWLISDDFILTSEYERLTIPRDIFEFDIQGTIDQLQNETKRTFFSLFKKTTSVQLPLKVFIKKNHPDIEHLQSLDYIDSEQTILKLKEMAQNLESHPLNIIYLDEGNIPFKEIAAQSLSIPDELSLATIKNFISNIDEQIIGSMETFSLLETVEVFDSLQNSDQELSFIATAMYKIFLQTDLDIVKRTKHLQVPDYASPGTDVLISLNEKKDLTVQNSNPTAYQINASLEKRELHISIATIEQALTYNYVAKNEKPIKPRTIYRYSDELSAGDTKVIQKGEDGFSVDIYRQTLNNNDQIMTEEQISNDVYLPTPKIILASTEDVHEEDSTVDTELINDELDDIEQSLGNFNQWLTGSVNNDGDEETISNPFFYFIPGYFMPFLENQEADFYERFTRLEEMINNDVHVNDETVLARLVDLELRLEVLKEQYEDIINALKEHELLEKVDE